MVQRKLGTGITQLRSSRTSQEGTTLTIEETYTGPYADLAAKQVSVQLGAKGTNLVPTEAGNGQLTVTYESTIGPPTGGSVVLEVIWQELRQSVELNPKFAALNKDQKAACQAAAENHTPLAYYADETQHLLLKKLTDKVGDWVTAVPVVRRTTTKVNGSLTTHGGAWYRENPPVTVAGSWEWMKTRDERRKDGKSFTQTEEWQAATIWDHDLYPIPAP